MPAFPASARFRRLQGVPHHRDRPPHGRAPRAPAATGEGRTSCVGQRLRPTMGSRLPRENGAPQDPGWTSESFTKLAEDWPDVPRIVFHGMRHTHATLLLEDGVSIKAVAERLGDRESTVLRIYGHITPRGRVAAANRVESWLAGVSPGIREQSVSEARL